MKTIFLFSCLGICLVVGDINDNKTDEKRSCQPEWTYFSPTGFCYKVFQNANWVEAEKICQRNSGHLASIHSKAEAFFIAKLGSTVPGREIFIGTFTSINDGQSKWENTDQTSFNYPYWGPKDPSDHPHETCVEMHLYANEFMARTGDLNNVDCHKLQKFICKAMP